jgi:hypothetical protein
MFDNGKFLFIFEPTKEIEFIMRSKKIEAQMYKAIRIHFLNTVLVWLRNKANRQCTDLRNELKLTLIATKAR